MPSCKRPPEASDTILREFVGRPLLAGSAGLPEYDGGLMEYRIVDKSTGEVCPANKAGILHCRGYLLMQGYCNVDAQPILDEGWIDTGDIGYFDSNGNFALVGREKQSYRINGENVSPEFVESILTECDEISHAVIVGVPDAKIGEVGFLFVEFKRADPSNYRLMAEYCTRHLAHYQIPCYFFELSSGEWPLTSSGKAKRSELQERALSLLAQGNVRSLVARSPKL